MIFADTYYYLALLSARDQGHERAVNYCKHSSEPVMTTDWVIVEIGNACCAPSRRIQFVALLEIMMNDEQLTIVSATDELMRKGVDLYTNRPDKHWSLTDCISFVVMQEHGVTDALTADQHFEQAGFVPLLAVR